MQDSGCFVRGPPKATHSRGGPMKRVFALLTTIVLSVASVAAKGPQSARPFTIDDLIKIRRVSDPQLSPDGRLIVYTIADTDKAANKRTTQVYAIPVDGGEPVALTSDKQSSHSPRWSPDGKRLAVVSARDGESQIWITEVTEAKAGAVRKLTNISTGADAPVWSPDGKWIAFRSDVYPAS